MALRKGTAVWTGNLKEGSGRVSLGSGAFEGNYSFSSRFEEGAGTNPEELIGAAHAACFSMALSAGLSKAGFEPKSVKTTASVYLIKEGEGFGIGRIELDCEADVPRISEEQFQQEAEGAKKNCPVSRALAGTTITLKARKTTSA